MIGLHIKKIDVIHKEFAPQISAQQTFALTKLKEINKNLFSNVEKDYLIDVIELFKQPNFIIQGPSQIDQIMANIGVIPPNSRFNKNGKPKKQLKKYIQEALNYKGLRNTFYPQYFQKVGIKACVYCNLQLTTTAVKTGNIYMARFDVDHYRSKDKYPFLSISLFNLYPSCASCNRIKGIKNIQFDLYTDDPIKTKTSSFTFRLDPYAKANYLTSKDVSALNFKFEEPSVIGVESFQETFHIEEIYKTQQDIIEELVIKSQIYCTSYKEQLRSDFSKLALNQKIFERFLVGNYIEDKDLHKRPMAKFMQDIAKQLEII